MLQPRIRLTTLLARRENKKQPQANGNGKPLAGMEKAAAKRSSNASVNSREENATGTCAGAAMKCSSSCGASRNPSRAMQPVSQPTAMLHKSVAEWFVHTDDDFAKLAIAHLMVRNGTMVIVRK